MFLSRFFPNYENSKAHDYTEALVKNNKIQLAYNRFNRLDDDFSSGRKSKKDIFSLLIKVILPELEIIKSHTK